ncbi:hypothetical protein QCA50_008635 [Cerrena zonata]|uniref:Uncharacterized protein n=1 Tax=Cerrena zonata TaxID=2478898 RepID=A0AAW0GAU4_9APHY
MDGHVTCGVLHPCIVRNIDLDRRKVFPKWLHARSLLEVQRSTLIGPHKDLRSRRELPNKFDIKHSTFNRVELTLVAT